MKKTKLLNTSAVLTLFVLAHPASASPASFSLMDYFKQMYSELMQSTISATLESGTKRPDKHTNGAIGSDIQLNTGPLMTQRSGTRRPGK